MRGYRMKGYRMRGTGRTVKADPPALSLPAGSRAFRVIGDGLEPDFHDGEVLLIAPRAGRHVAPTAHGVRIVGEVVARYRASQAH